MPLSIRPVEKADWSGWRRLWTGYLDFYQTTVTDEVYRTTFDRLTSGASGEFVGFLAIDGSHKVGLAHCLSHRHCWKIENVIYLQDLFVDPAMRGHGIGRALIEHVYAYADQSGSPTVYWLTKSDNTPARALYDTLATESGFVRYNR